MFLIDCNHEVINCEVLVIAQMDGHGCYELRSLGLDKRTTLVYE